MAIYGPVCKLSYQAITVTHLISCFTDSTHYTHLPAVPQWNSQICLVSQQEPLFLNNANQHIGDQVLQTSLLYFSKSLLSSYAFIISFETIFYIQLSDLKLYTIA